MAVGRAVHVGPQQQMPLGQTQAATKSAVRPSEVVATTAEDVVTPSVGKFSTSRGSQEVTEGMCAMQEEACEV